MLMKSFRLLWILFAVVVVVPNYEMYQLDGKGNEHSAFAAEPQVPPLQSWISAIKSPKKLVYVKPKYGIATIQRRWKRVNPEKHIFTIPTINSVEIFCTHDNHRCTETMAFVYSKSMDHHLYCAFKDGELYARSNEYEIREWSEDLILAVKIMPVAMLELRIFPKTKTADRIYAEREDPNVFSRYVLE
jgi:hypothetical protein